MKKFAIPALATALALAACADADAPANGDDATDTAAAPAATETTVIHDTETVPVEGATDDKGSSLTVDGDNVDVKADEDGVKATVDTNGE